ncbi:hypothetical protein NL676_000104 [Syzygium grande]|nr:hypothetical protein NL676_000104 [Syzygium grande]
MQREQRAGTCAAGEPIGQGREGETAATRARFSRKSERKVGKAWENESENGRSPTERKECLRAKVSAKGKLEKRTRSKNGSVAL